MSKPSFLVIQTAFIGDAILATALLEKLHQHYPDAAIDLLIRKGNEGLFSEHPFINKLIVWHKKGNKYRNLLGILKSIRKKKYDYLINLQRYATTGLFAAFSKSKQKIGYSKNPFSRFFDVKIEHEIGNGLHEVERNQSLIAHLTDEIAAKPGLYPSIHDFGQTVKYKSGNYITISPTSVWFTKQFPKEKWVEFINTLDNKMIVYLLGGPDDKADCKEIEKACAHKNTKVLAGEINLLESAALMKDALMNYCNDSAPLHLASSMDAPAIAVFCSTVPDFGFGPLSTDSKIVEIDEDLDCRPCGLHGKKSCPLGHFKCAYNIDIDTLKLS